jgi:hypothetical protein
MMRGGRIKAAAQYVGGLAIVAFFVVLLSITFSFLGTIFCAALAGMMLGTMRTHKWHAVPVSLLFPGLIWALLKGMRTQLGAHQVLMVSLACLAMFWVSYAMAAALFYFERKKPQAPVAAAPSRTAVLPFPDGATPLADASPRRAPPRSGGRLGPPSAVSPDISSSLHPSESGYGRQALQEALRRTGEASLPGVLSLDMLEGEWTRQANGHPHSQGRRLSIQKEKLVLFGMDAEGKLRVLAQDEVRLCPRCLGQACRLWEPVAAPDADTLVSI